MASIACVQGSEEWHQQRLMGIGASEAAIVLGISPYKTRYQLWEEKLELRMPDGENPAMARGKRLEPVAKGKVEDLLGESLFPEMQCIDEHPFIRASLDGISMDGSVAVEIKCPWAKPGELATESELYQKALRGEIPDYYMAQMQQQMAVTGLKSMYYYCFDGKDGMLIKVDRDDELIAKIIKEDIEFWNLVITKTPPELCDKDLRIIDTPEWKTLAEEWKEIDREIDRLKDREKDLRKKMISAAGDASGVGEGVKLTRYLRPGNVDYDLIEELKGVNLEKYRKKPSVCYRVTAV